MPALELIGHRYEIIDKIGSGGMGAVFRARDLLSNEEVALKRVIPDGIITMSGVSTTSKDLRVAMAQEFKTLAALRHPNIIAVRDYGFDEESQPYFTMDLLENAQNVLQAGQGRGLSVQMGFLAQILQALAYLHRRHIIHRDLKAENVLVVDGQVKVLDFGLSVVKQQQDETDNAVAGTLSYMAPELLQHAEASEATDMYAVGVLAYELMAGHHPFDTKDARKLISQIINDYPDLSQIDADFPVVRFVGQLMEKNPEQRLSRAVEALQALNEVTAEDFPVETADTRESFLQSVRLVGRDKEVATLTSALNRARDSRGSAWLVGGESGVGKSRLIDEIRIQAMVQGILVLRGQAVSEAGGVYQVWQSVLRWVELISEKEMPTVASLLPGGSAINFTPKVVSVDALQERLLKLILDTVHDVKKPVMLILEDLQWAGTESVSMLQRLCKRIKNLPLLVVATYRDDEAPDMSNNVSGAEHMALERLSEESIAEISRDMLGEVGTRPQVVDLLQRETEGNVYFLVEVVRALAEEAGNLDQIGLTTLPQQVFSGGIKRIIERRIAQVPLHARDLLYIAAAYGRRLDVKLLAHIAPDTDMDWWLLVCSEAAILDVEDEQWRFTHDRLREEILKRIPEVGRIAMHQQIAQTMEDLYSDSTEHMIALAYHWRMAETPEREERYAVKAGELSLHSGAYQETIQFMERALELSATTHDENELIAKQLEYKRTLAKAYLGLGEYEEAERLYRENLTQNELRQHLPGIALALANLGLVMIVLERYEQAKDFFEESLSDYRKLQDDGGIIHVLNHLGDIEYELGNQTRAKALYQESLHRSREIGSGWGMAGSTGKTDTEIDLRAIAAYEEKRQKLLDALSEARRSGDKRIMAQTLQDLGVTELQGGDPKEAFRLLKLSMESFRVLNITEGVISSLQHLGDLMFTTERYDEAEGYYRQGLKVSLNGEAQAPDMNLLFGLAQSLVKQEHHTDGLTLLAYLLHNPTTPDTIVDAAEEMIFELEDAVPPNDASTAWERGKSLSMGDIASQYAGSSE